MCAIAINVRFRSAIKTVCGRLAGCPAVWVFTGSLGMALQGVPLRPGDIDIQTDAPGAYEIERRLAEFVLNPVSLSSTERIRSHFGSLSIDGFRVEIMGDVQKRMPDGSWDPPPDLKAHRKTVLMEEFAVPVLSVEYEAEAYARLGRRARAAQLRAWLRNVTTGHVPG